ncbi:hypothetical protein NQ314_008597 [Rhamnusium bicolor]|uniref:ZAD domain-containing protein n=1 Tax=Rhamnusium bicolor TaxID=1586634 RepID=A0AAV8Y7G4_9CUCU|nr:hypothetical protein NQ314_008597 [Rhamnusium bicolor]
MKYGEKICRLCFKTCYIFQALKEMTREMLDMLLLKINLSISEEPIICTKCAETLKNIFDFKSACFCTRDCIVKNGNNAKVDLKDIMCLSKKEKENVISEAYTICNFCMNLAKSCYCTPLDNEGEGVIVKNMLEKCLPELVCTYYTCSYKNYIHFDKAY